MSADDFWKQQAEGFGRFLRAQRKLADLSLRELAAMADVSNAYVSQLERGQHQPSVRVLRALAEALNISYQRMLTQAGVLQDDDLSEDRKVSEDSAAGRSGNAEPSSRRTLTEAAILADPLLTVEQDHRDRRSARPARGRVDALESTPRSALPLPLPGRAT